MFLEFQQLGFLLQQSFLLLLIRADCGQLRRYRRVLILGLPHGLGLFFPVS